MVFLQLRSLSVTEVVTCQCRLTGGVTIPRGGGTPGVLQEH